MTTTAWPQADWAYIEVPIYNLLVHMAFDEATDDIYRERFNLRERDWVQGECRRVKHVETGEERLVIYINPAGLTEGEIMLLIGHECLHAAYFMLEIVGVKHSSDNHEALAYLHEWLSKKAMQCYRLWDTTDGKRNRLQQLSAPQGDAPPPHPD